MRIASAGEPPRNDVTSRLTPTALIVSQPPPAQEKITRWTWMDLVIQGLGFALVIARAPRCACRAKQRTQTATDPSLLGGPDLARYWSDALSDLASKALFAVETISGAGLM